MDEKTVRRRYELMDRICYSVCIGNEFQTVRAVQSWVKLDMQSKEPKDLTEWKYDLIRQEALIIQSLREIGVPEFSLEEVRVEYSVRIRDASDVRECRRLLEELSVRFCHMNSMKEIQRYPMLIQTVLQTIDRDLSQPLTLQYFAKLLNVNSSYLSSLFSREVGTTLTEYVTAQRVSYAADLLLTTQEPIKTIAKKAGIPDVQYFSRLFKKKTGQTPSQYRMRSET